MKSQPQRTIARTVPHARHGLLAGALAASVASLASLTGCGSAPSCDKVVSHVAGLRDLGASEAALALERCKREDWPDALRSCAAKAKDADDLERCTAKRASSSSGGGGYAGYMARSKMSEAELNLRAIEKGLKMTYIETAAFPVGEVGPTPTAGSCCLGPGKKCAPDPSLWTGVDVWDQLDFEVTEPAYFSYAYRSTSGARATAEAIGDLDCDGVMATYTLACEAVNGEPRCETTRPPRAD